MWEYKVIELRKEESLKEEEQVFNEIGAEGWELVAVTSDTEEAYSLAYFKRRKN